MKKVISFLLAGVLVLQLSVPAFAADSTTGVSSDLSFSGVQLYNSAFSSSSAIAETLRFAVLEVVKRVYGPAWSAVASAAIPSASLRLYWQVFENLTNANSVRYGETSKTALLNRISQLNRRLSDKWENGPFSSVTSRDVNWYYYIPLSSVFIYEILGLPNVPKFELVKLSSINAWVIWDTANDIQLVNSNGQYQFALDTTPQQDSTSTDRPHWVSQDYVFDRMQSGKTELAMLSRYALDSIVKNAFSSPSYSISKPYQYRFDDLRFIVWENDADDALVWCDAEGRPYACWDNEQYAMVGTPQTITEYKYDDPDLSEYYTKSDIDNKLAELGLDEFVTKLDLDTMFQQAPASDGGLSTAYIDESTYNYVTNTYHNKTINVSDNDTYNFYNYNYHINYTSITYIGQTEQQNEYYSCYYELPDGRSSADLTAAELEQLNTTLQIINYNRSNDEYAIRCLYHFDENTDDSSAFNAHADVGFTWDSGASLTYMDSGNFNGALYLDETAHGFTITLPTALASGDFTIQWRMFSSATLSAAKDTFLSIGSTPLMYFTGRDIFGTGNTSISQQSVGSWQEYALIRDSGTLRYYRNGLQIASQADTAIYGNTISFTFGTSQQTYKYFDELRVLDKALVTRGNSYEPTAIPYDSNLILVLPDFNQVDASQTLIDEYVSVTQTGTNMLASYHLDWWDNAHSSDSGFQSSKFYAHSGLSTSLKSSYYGSFYQSLPRGGSSSYGSTSDATYDCYYFPYAVLYSNFTDYSLSSSSSGGSTLSVRAVPQVLAALPSTTGQNELSPQSFTLPALNGLSFKLGFYRNSYLQAYSSSANPSLTSSQRSPFTYNSTYTFSCVFSDGASISLPFTISSSTTPLSVSSHGYNFLYTRVASYSYGTVYDWEDNRNSNYGSAPTYFFNIVPINGQSQSEIVYMSFETGSTSTVHSEWVQEFANEPGQDYSDFLALAVRSDITVANKQIGGVRPPLPGRGDVYASVERGFITSIQQYDGQGWIPVDGRIWTGQRWIPYSSYNVVIMSDMYDIDDASGQSGYEYIYTDSGFWDWWQREWLDFRKWFASVFSGGTSSSPDSGEDYDAVTDKVSTIQDNDSGTEWDVTEDEYGEGEGEGEQRYVSVFHVIWDAGKGLFAVVKMTFGIAVNAIQNVGKASHVFSDAFDDSSDSYAFGVFDLDFGGGDADDG